MRRLELIAISAFALLSATCSARVSGPPEIVVDRTVCGHCGMFVSEPVYAAAYQADGGELRVFDEIGCLLEAMRREVASPTNVWFQDAAGGGWLDAEKAIFVASPQVATPMNGGVLAYADAAAAEKAITAHGGEVVRSFRELMTRKGDAR